MSGIPKRKLDFKPLDGLTYNKYLAMINPEPEPENQLSYNRFPEVQKRTKRKPPVMKRNLQTDSRKENMCYFGNEEAFQMGNIRKALQ